MNEKTKTWFWLVICTEEDLCMILKLLLGTSNNMFVIAKTANDHEILNKT